MRSMVLAGVALLISGAALAQSYYTVPLDAKDPSMGFTTTGPEGTYYSTPMDLTRPTTGGTVTRGPRGETYYNVPLDPDHPEMGSTTTLSR